MRLEQRGCDSTLEGAGSVENLIVGGKPGSSRRGAGRRAARYGSQRAGRGRNAKPLPDAAAPPQPNPRGTPPGCHSSSPVLDTARPSSPSHSPASYPRPLAPP